MVGLLFILALFLLCILEHRTKDSKCLFSYRISLIKKNYHIWVFCIGISILYIIYDFLVSDMIGTSIDNAIGGIVYSVIAAFIFYLVNDFLPGTKEQFNTKKDLLHFLENDLQNKMNLSFFLNRQGNNGATSDLDLKLANFLLEQGDLTTIDELDNLNTAVLNFYRTDIITSEINEIKKIAGRIIQSCGNQLNPIDCNNLLRLSNINTNFYMIHSDPNPFQKYHTSYITLGTFVKEYDACLKNVTSIILKIKREFGLI